MNPGDTFLYSPNNHLIAQNTGVHSLRVGFYLPNDSDYSNDTAYAPVFVDTYPIVNLPQDTSINGNQSILLDPGSGYDSYLWYNNDTTSTITVDSTGIGYGSVAAWVEVANGICVNTDTTVVTFVVFQSVENTIENKSISIYPNPSTDFINIESELADINLVNVFNIDGKLISTLKIGKNDRIDITNLPKGIYYLHFNTDQGTITRKIVKQ